MIDAKSLRIGNWLMYHGEEDMPCQIDSQDIHNIATRIADNNIIHTPIELSPDILTKAGFEKEIEHWVKDGVKIYNAGERFYHMSECFLTHFDSLHHFQNWYYFNTMEELPITL